MRVLGIYPAGTVIVFLIMLSSGCVSNRTHEATLQDLDNTRNSLDSAQQEIERTKQEAEKIQQQLKGARIQFDKAQDEHFELEIKRQDLQKELNESKNQLETLRELETETKRRNEIYAEFVNRLQNMIDGGQLTVTIEKGRIVINLPDNVLFESGSANINSKGQEALTQIAGVLGSFKDRRFQIEGHTDDQPISSARFPSNWELSAARALAVVHLLIEAGVPAGNVSAAGFGEFQPRADNASPEGRKLNRRIEIVMLPNLDILSSELPKVAP